MYITKQVSFRNRVLILFDWVSLFFAAGVGGAAGWGWGGWGWDSVGWGGLVGGEGALGRRGG